jgi:outer membrane protein assembly factor BamB
MIFFRARRTLSPAILVAVCAAHAPAAPAPTAEQVVKEIGVTAGLAVHVGTTDGALEADLTNNGPSTISGQGKMLVQGLALSDEAAAKARKHFFEKKIYGLASVSAVKTAATLPYYDRLVNLLVADLDALGKDAPPSEEIDRVLGYEGVAYLKKNGRWTKTVKPTPAEVDRGWTHYGYDATRNAVSKDRIVGPPNAVRWLGGPTGRNPMGGPRTSDGVFVEISIPYNGRLAAGGRGHQPLPWAPVDGTAIFARDVQSGVLLWYRTLCRDMGLSYSASFVNTFVATGGRVYGFDFTAKDQVALTAWNIHTGAVEKVFDQGAVFRNIEDAAASDKRAVWPRTAHQRLAYNAVLVHDGKVVHSLRERLLVMDAASGRVLWTQAFPEGVHCEAVMVSEDRLIGVLIKPWQGGDLFKKDSPYVALEAWRLKDGTPVWRYGLQDWIYPGDWMHGGTFGCTDRFLPVPVSRTMRKKDNAIILLDAREGRPVWQKPLPTMTPYTMSVIGNRIWYALNQQGGFFDLATGEHTGFGPPHLGACQASCGTPNYFMLKKYFMPVDQPEDRGPQNVRYCWMRALGMTCAERLAPSYGSVFMLHPVCSCESHLTGTAALYAVQPTTPVRDDQRLSKPGAAALGPVQPQREAFKAPGAFDWGKPEGLRGLFWRSAAKGAPIMPIWLGYGLIETPAVKAADCELAAYVQEHRLAARKDSREIWNFIAGARIGSPPVVHGGLAIFGSHDGSVYAVNIKDGSPAWRFLAAPADRRHVVMGQVESAWPVFGVTLHEGKLYVSAGRHAELDGGVHLYGLDPASGRMDWHVRYQCGLSSDQHTPKPGGADRNKRIINDIVQVREGKVWLFDQAVVDLADPKDVIINPETLAPHPWRAVGGPSGAAK